MMLYVYLTGFFKNPLLGNLETVVTIKSSQEGGV